MLAYALYEYIPKRRIYKASFEQLDLNRRILDFKDGRNYASRWAAHTMAYALQAVDLSDTVVMCIPAHSQHAYVRRYKRFLSEFCSRSNAVNGFDYVRIHGCREMKHLSAQRHYVSCMSNASIDAGIRGRKVLVIDDICTTCSSAATFISCLRAAGAEVVMAMFLARTKRCWM
ncbi:MAG: phosphoribosyltransferase [Prevotella sp.]|nr:phosphoribosyltransferase [Prevotella sp.]